MREARAFCHILNKYINPFKIKHKEKTTIAKRPINEKIGSALAKNVPANGTRNKAKPATIHASSNKIELLKA